MACVAISYNHSTFLTLFLAEKILHPSKYFFQLHSNNTIIIEFKISFIELKKNFRSTISTDITKLTERMKMPIRRLHALGIGEGVGAGPLWCSSVVRIRHRGDREAVLVVQVHRRHRRVLTVAGC